MKTWRQFDQMRGDHRRDWFRRSDIIDAIKAEGLKMNWHDARKALALLPRTEKRYGHFRYTDQHREAVLAYGRQINRSESHA